MSFPIPANETARLEALYQYSILDTAAEPEFDDLACLAAQICRTPIALISFVDAERVWFKFRLGLTVTEMARNDAFCSHALSQTELFIVPDTLKDERFATNRLVLSQPYARFYAGMPLVTAKGCALGTLCVMDCIPRKLSQDQREGLSTLARQVMTQLELRRNSTNPGNVSEASKLSRAIFDAAAKRNLHLAVAELPTEFWAVNLAGMQRDRETMTCLRSVLMKPEHLEWIPRIWNELSAATTEVLRSEGASNVSG